MTSSEYPHGPAIGPCPAHAGHINEISRQLMLLRPDLFNHATRYFAEHQELMCFDIPVNASMEGQPASPLSVVDPMMLLKTDGQFGVDFFFQIGEPRVDDQTPVELDPTSTEARHVALIVQLHGGLLCPKPAARPSTNPSPEYFRLDVLTTAAARWVGARGNRQLAIAVDAIDIADAELEHPTGALACYLATTVEVGILPRVQAALESATFELAQLITDAVCPRHEWQPPAGYRSSRARTNAVQSAAR